MRYHRNSSCDYEAWKPGEAVTQECSDFDTLTAARDANTDINNMIKCKDSDTGWVSFPDGSDSPVDIETIVEVKLRDGKISQGKSMFFCWYKSKYLTYENDIMEYRVITHAHP